MTPNASNTVILNGTGVVARPGPTLDDPPEILAGFHANTVAEVMAANPHLEARRVSPATPMFVIFGDDGTPRLTVCLWWADHAQMMTDLGPGMAAAEPEPEA